MGDLVLSGGTSGTITVTPTAVAGSNTLTLPAATGTILTTASSGQIIPKAALPTGSVLQVVNNATTTEASTSSTSFQDTGLTATISPTSSTSKILVIVSLGDVSSSNASASNGVTVRLLRGASQTGGNFAQQWSYGPTGTFLIQSGGFSYLDSPATTSSTTYKVQFRAQGSGPTVAVMRDATQGSLTLLEIAA